MNAPVKPPPKTTPSLREKSKLKTLAAIRQAAWSLFVEKGFDGATTREIAERAKVAAGTVFVHAKDKDELLAMVFQQRVTSAFEQGLEAVDEELPLTDRLVRVFGAFFEEYRLQPELAQRFLCVTLTLKGPHGQEQSRVEEAVISRLAALLERARERGETREDLDVRGYAQNLFALYRFTVFRWLASDERTDPEAGTARLRECFAVAHIGARPKAKKRADASESDERRSLRVSATPPRRSTATPPKGVERPSMRALAAPKVPADLLVDLGLKERSTERPPRPSAPPARRPNR